MRLKLRRKKEICIVNPSDDLLARFIEEGIDSFTIDKVEDVSSICIKNNRKNRKILKNFDLKDSP
jgi:hypothetical protein